MRNVIEMWLKWGFDVEIRRRDSETVYRTNLVWESNSSKVLDQAIQLTPILGRGWGCGKLLEFSGSE